MFLLFKYSFKQSIQRVGCRERKENKREEEQKGSKSESHAEPWRYFKPILSQENIRRSKIYTPRQLHRLFKYYYLIGFSQIFQICSGYFSQICPLNFLYFSPQKPPENIPKYSRRPHKIVCAIIRFQIDSKKLKISENLEMLDFAKKIKIWEILVFSHIF